MRIGALPIGLQQLIELARVLFSGARIIILDEPTSALSPPEVERLFAVLRGCKDSGRSIVFISHFLDDILRISDTVTIFRNGRKIVTEPTAGIDKRWVIERMIGDGHDELEESYTGAIALDSAPTAPVVLRGRRAHRRARLPRRLARRPRRRGARHLRLHGLRPARARPHPVRQAPRRTAARLTVAGKPVRFRNTAAARRAGIAFVPESRRSMLFYHEPLYKNISIAILERISRLWLKPAAERAMMRSARSSACTSGRPVPRRSSAPSPAATSRRWRWRSG